MALVRMVRAVPEVAGGKTEAMVPEEAVSDALKNGWSRADESAARKEEPKQEQLEAETPVTETKTESEKKPGRPKKELRDA